MAGRIGDGYWGNAPDRALLDTFEAAGGHGPRYAQLRLCWADDVEEARATVHERWPNAGITGQLSQDLPTWTHFEQATAPLTVEPVASDTPCGPDIAPELERVVRRYRDAGYDHLFHQVGHDRDGFFRFWDRELRPALRDLTAD